MAPDTLIDEPCVTVQYVGEPAAREVSLRTFYRDLPRIRDVVGMDPVSRAQFYKLAGCIVSRSFTVNSYGNPERLADDFFDVYWGELFSEYVEKYLDDNANSFHLDTFMQAPNITFQESYKDDAMAGELRVSPELGGKGSSAARMKHGRGRVVLQYAIFHIIAQNRGVLKHDGDTFSDPGRGIIGPGLRLSALVEGSTAYDILMRNITDKHFIEDDIPTWEKNLDGGKRADTAVRGVISLLTRMYARTQLTFDGDTLVSSLVGRGDTFADTDAVHDVYAVVSLKGSSLQDDAGKPRRSTGEVATAVYTNPPYVLRYAMGRSGGVRLPVSVSGPVVANSASKLAGASTYVFPVSSALMSPDSVAYRAFIDAHDLISAVCTATYRYAAQVTTVKSTLTRGDMGFIAIESVVQGAYSPIERELIERISSSDTPQAVLKDILVELKSTAQRTLSDIDARAPIFAHLPGSNGSRSLSASARFAFNRDTAELTKYIEALDKETVQ